MGLNVADFVVAAVILAFGLVGLVSGFIRTAFRLTSFFIAAFVAICTYPVVSNFIVNNTDIDDRIKTSIVRKVAPGHQDVSAEADTGGGQDTGDRKNIDLSKIPLPDNLKKQLESLNFTGPGTQTSAQPEKSAARIEETGNAFAVVLINIISVVLIFIAVKIVLALIRFVLECIAKLPVFNQLNMIGGFVLGALEGLLVIYLIGAALTLFVTSKEFEAVFSAIDSSLYTRHIYYNNFLLNWILTREMPGGIIL